ncbi:hypothetical protein ACW5W4_13445 [Aeromonas crassostreae]
MHGEVPTEKDLDRFIADDIYRGIGWAVEIAYIVGLPCLEINNGITLQIHISDHINIIIIGKINLTEHTQITYVPASIIDLLAITALRAHHQLGHGPVGDGVLLAVGG